MALLQSVLLSRVDILGARPDLMFLLVLVWALERGVDEGLVWGFIGGLIIDLRSGGPFGATALALAVMVFLASQPLGRALGPQVIRLLLLAVIGGLVYHLVLLVLMAVMGHTIYWGYALLHVALPSVLLNAVLAPFVLPLVAWMGRKLRREGLTLG